MRPIIQTFLSFYFFFHMYHVLYQKKICVPKHFSSKYRVTATLNFSLNYATKYVHRTIYHAVTVEYMCTALDCPLFNVLKIQTTHHKIELSMIVIDYIFDHYFIHINH